MTRPEEGPPEEAGEARTAAGRSPRDIAASLNTARAGSTEPAASAAPEPPPAPAPRTLDELAAVVAQRIDTARAGADAGDDEGELDADDDYVPPPPLREMASARTGIAELLLFRVGPELFATGLADVEEAVERAELHTLPHMPPAMLGVFELRGSLVPLYSPARALGVALAQGAATLVLSGDGRRIAVAVDEVSDVVQLDMSTIRPAPPAADPERILLGIVRRGGDLVGVVDGAALVAACAEQEGGADAPAAASRRDA